MHHHLRAPIEGTPRSSAIGEQAVAHAKQWGVRITFMHARPDRGHSDDDTLLHAVVPDSTAASLVPRIEATMTRCCTRWCRRPAGRWPPATPTRG